MKEWVPFCLLACFVHLAQISSETLNAAMAIFWLLFAGIAKARIERLEE